MQLLELILPVKLYCVLTLVCLFSEMLYLAIVHKGVPAPPHPLLRHPPLDPACLPPFENLCFPSPSFLFYPLLRYFGQFPLMQPPPALI